MNKSSIPTLMLALILVASGCQSTSKNQQVLNQSAAPVVGTNDGYPVIFYIGESAIQKFERGKRLVIPINGVDLFQSPLAWSVRVEGTVPAIRGEDYDLLTFANSPTNPLVSLGTAAIVLQTNYTAKLRDKCALTINADIVSASDDDIRRTLGDLKDLREAVSGSLGHTNVAMFNQSLSSIRALRYSFKASLPTTAQSSARQLDQALGDLPDANNATDLETTKAKLAEASGILREQGNTLLNQELGQARFPVIASGNRTFVLYSVDSYISQFLDTRLPLNDIKAFPIPDEEALELFGEEVTRHFYTVAFTALNTSGQERVLNTGLINAYGRAIVYPVGPKDNDEAHSFTVPVQVSPQSLQQVYSLVSGSKWKRNREWIFRSLEFGGSLATAIATGFKGSPDLIKALGIYTGVGIPALGKLWPDPVPSYLANIVNYGMPELVKVPQNASIAYRLLFFSKDDLHSMISDSHMFSKKSGLNPARRSSPLNKPETFVVYLSFDTLEVPYETTLPSTNASNPMTISISPSTSTNITGDSVSFSGSASGAGTLSYQWRFNGADLPEGPNVIGTKSAKLTLNNVVKANAGNYSLIVTDSAGRSTNSLNAVLTLTDPTINLVATVKPESQEKKTGESATFDCQVVGGTPSSYQWLHEGTNLIENADCVGTTNALLMLSHLSAKSQGQYTVMVKDAIGRGTNSSAGQLTIH